MSSLTTISRGWYYLVAVAASACAQDTPTPDSNVRREVAGDTTTVRTVAGQIWSSDPTLVEEAVVGELSGAPELTFGEITRMASDREGGVYVLDRQVPVIRHFDRTGTLLGTIGRDGRGPGEYQDRSLGMAVDPSGVLYMHDWRNSRVVRFDADGSPLGPWPIPSSFLTTARGSWVYSNKPGQVLVTARVGDQPALLVLQDGAAVDSMIVPTLPGMPELRGGPYRIDTYWSWHPSGYFVVGVSNEYSLEARRSDGILRIERDVERVPVHPEEAAEIRRRFEWMEAQPHYMPPEGEWVPDAMPYFSGIETSSDGRIWVRRNVQPVQVEVQAATGAAPPLTWIQPFVYDVFKENGDFLGQVRLPEGFEPHLFEEGAIWGVRRGEFDEQYVVRLSLREPG